MTLADKINPSDRKRILGLDGGGIRGLITLEILAEIEDMLRKRLAASDEFRLAHYFDFIGGTSTGAVIATALSLGMSVAEVRRFYRNNGKAMFDSAAWYRRFRYNYEADNLATLLREVFGADTTLGTAKLQTLLLLVMRNATTDSPWPVTNNPYAKYNDRARKNCNLHLPLWQLVRASAAAPTYFPPEVVRIGEDDFVFVDGGITMYNNPAFLMFLKATVEPYRLQWQTGEDKMLIVSIGTGTNPEANRNLDPNAMNKFYNATSVPSALMHAASNEQDMLCRVFGRCRHGAQLDREIGDLRNTGGPAQPRAFTYLRYNAELTRAGLHELGLADIDPACVQALDAVEHMDDLRRVGRAAAERQITPEHFEGFV